MDIFLSDLKQYLMHLRSSCSSLKSDKVLVSAGTLLKAMVVIFHKHAQVALQISQKIS